MTESNAKHDIFVSYAKVDFERVRPIVTKLRAHGWRVWWDDRLEPGDMFHDEILAAIESSRGMLVIWSEQSVKKKWVLEEATAGEGREAFITIRIDDCTPPLGFRSYHAYLVSDGEGLDLTALDVVIRRFEKTLSRPDHPSQVASTRKAPRRNSPRSHALRSKRSPEVVRAFVPRKRWTLFGIAAAIALAVVVSRMNPGDSNVGASFAAKQRRSTTPGSISEGEHPVTGARYPWGWDVLDATPADGAWATEVREPTSGVVFRLIPAGSFQMGSPQDEPGRQVDETLHHVTLTWPFYMAVTEITIEQAARIEGTDAYRGPKPLPMNWQMAHSACQKMGWQLPTEAQWEYAARGKGAGRLFWWGDDPADGAGKANLFDESAEEATHKRREFPFNDSHPNVAPVGEYEPNGFGLFDMTGNLWEWCLDGYYADYGQAPAVDPETRWHDERRILRGGSWNSRLDESRLAYRHFLERDVDPYEELGLRPVVNLP